MPCHLSRSLAIRAGYRGARLSHGHCQQYQFALQTLTLWREVSTNIHVQWYGSAERAKNPYIRSRTTCSSCGVWLRTTFWTRTTTTVSGTPGRWGLFNLFYVLKQKWIRFLVLTTEATWKDRAFLWQLIQEWCKNYLTVRSENYKQNGMKRI